MTQPPKLDDEVLTDIAWRAIRRFFPADELTGAELELRRKKVELDDSKNESAINEIIEVLLKHQSSAPFSNHAATEEANFQMINEAAELDDKVLVLLFHGFPDSPSNRRDAA